MKTVYALVGMLAAGVCFAQPPVQIVPVDPAPKPNLVRNSSFEEVQNDLPVGWSWDGRNTQATVAVVSEPGAVGARCLKFTNTTPFAPEQYALLRYEGGVPVKPGTVYTLSCRYKTRSSFVGFIGGGQNWRVRLLLENTDGQWQTASLTFATRENETQFDLVIVIEAPTDALWIDAVKLEENRTATPYVPAEAMSQPLMVFAPLPPRLYLAERRWQAEVEFYTPQPLPNAELTAQLGRQRVHQRVDLPAGASKAVIRLPEPRKSETTLQVSLHTGNRTFAIEHPLIVFTRRQAESRLRAIQNRLPRWQQQLEQVRRRGQDVAYPQASLTILQEFVGYVADDLRKGQIERAFAQLDEMEAIANRLEHTLRECLQGARTLPTVPRYITSRVAIQNASLIAETEDPLTRKRQRRPVFFVGFGHFGQVRRDIEKFPLMGFNLIQIERGVWDFLPEPNKVSRQALEEDILPTFERAARANVKIDFLISPHYMPEWVYQVYPHLKQPREGFIKYSLFAPESLMVLREYLSVLLPALSRQPALLSLCLSNEPVNRESPESPLHQQAWRRWLQNRHKTLITLNSRWQTRYQSWDEIPIPTEGIPYTEWLEFNADALADWHRQLAGIVSEFMPHIPKHAKLMSWTFLNDRELHQGVDPERFADFCELNGNDSFNSYVHDQNAPWAFEWIRNWMAYDFQRSLKDAPIINSENHIIPDRERRRVPPAHARAVLWEGAVRGMSATTFWVWERTDDPQSDFAGSLLHRPAIVEALAHTTLDLNRLAPYVAALQNQPFEVHILHARTDLAVQGPEQIIPRDNLYIALSMLGVKVGFITERQLITGRVPETVKRILIPNVQYLSDEAVFALDQLRQRRGVILIGVGEPLLSFDLYGRRRSTRPPIQTLERNIELDALLLARKLEPQLQTWGVSRPLRLLKPDADQPAWGIAYRTAPYENGFLANLCNYTHQPITVRLVDPQGNPIKATNLLDGSTVDGSLTLQPLEPVLLKW